MKAFEIRSIFIASSIAAALILSSFSLVSARVIQPLHLIEQPATISGTPACQTLSKISNLYYYNTAKWKNALKGNDFQKAKATIHDALSTASYDPSGLPGSTYGEIEDVITRLNYSIDPIEAQRNVDLMSDLVRLVKPIACGTSSSGLTIRSSTYSIKFLEDIELATIASEQAKLGQEYQTAIALNACAIGDAVSRSGVITTFKMHASETGTTLWDSMGTEILSRLDRDSDKNGLDDIKNQVSDFFAGGSMYISQKKKTSNRVWAALVSPASIKSTVKFGCRSDNSKALLASDDVGIAQKMQEIMTQLRDIEESMSIARSHIGFADQPKNVRDEILKNIIKTTKSEQIRQLAKGVLLGY